MSYGMPAYRRDGITEIAACAPHRRHGLHQVPQTRGDRLRRCPVDARCHISQPRAGLLTGLHATGSVRLSIAHFDGYSAVLIQLRKASGPELRDVMTDGWLPCAPAALAEEYLRRQA